MSALSETGDATRLEQCIRWYREEYPSIRDREYHGMVAEEAAQDLVQLNASNAELTEACEIWFDKYEVLEAENARLQKEMEEAKQVIILLKFDCEELSKQEFPNVLTSIEMAIAFLAKYGKEQK